MSSEVVLLVAFALAVYVAYRAVAARRKGNAAAARYQKMLQICAANGAVPGPVDVPGMFRLAGLPGFVGGLSNQFTNAADFSTVYESTRLFFTFVTARFPGIVMPHIAVTRKGIPGTAVYEQYRIGVESIAFTERFNITCADARLGTMLLDLPMIQWILDCADVNFEMSFDGLIAYVYRAEEDAPVLNRLFEARPLNSDGSELELLYRFVNGFGQRIPAQLRAELAAPAQ